MAENMERSDLEEDVVVNHKRINEERDSQESAATELPKLMPEENMKPPHLKEAVAHPPVSIAPMTEKGTRRRSSMAGGIRHRRRLLPWSSQGEQDTDRSISIDATAQSSTDIALIRAISSLADGYAHLHNRRPNEGPATTSNTSDVPSPSRNDNARDEPCALIMVISSLADGCAHLHNRGPNEGPATRSNTPDVPSPSRNDNAKRKRATSPSLADGDDAPFQEQAKPKPDDAPFQEQAKPKPDCSKEHAT